MHELAVCQALLMEVQRVARESHARAVVRIVVQVGPLSGLEPQLLVRAFEIARIGSVAEEAELHIEARPVRILCLDCDAPSDTAPNRLLCPRCGGWHTRLVSGDELILRRLEFRTASSGGPPLH